MKKIYIYFSMNHESEKKLRLNKSVCNSLQKWNIDECHCEYK